MGRLSCMEVRELSINGQQVDHFFDCFGSETFSLDEAVEYAVGGDLFSLSVEDKVVTTTKEQS